MKGVYAAIFFLEDAEAVEVGSLGKVKFEPGYYVYVGSAMNSVEKRLERHFSEVENMHWHIDYFSARADALDYFILPENSSKYECVLASILDGFADGIHRFGASDCNCNSHLFHLHPRGLE